MDKVLVYHICCNEYVPCFTHPKYYENNFPSFEGDTIVIRCFILTIKNAQIITQHVHVAHYKFVIIIDNVNLIFLNYINIS
jgi:hypothetical protein